MIKIFKVRSFLRQKEQLQKKNFGPPFEKDLEANVLVAGYIAGLDCSIQIAILFYGLDLDNTGLAIYPDWSNPDSKNKNTDKKVPTIPTLILTPTMSTTAMQTLILTTTIPTIAVFFKNKVGN
jgi:hypothetical protein